MKKELRQALSRLRKAQDAIFNNKLEGDPSLEIIAHGAKLSGASWATICAHQHNGVKCENTIICYIDENYTPEKMNEELEKISAFLNYTI